MRANAVPKPCRIDGLTQKRPDAVPKASGATVTFHSCCVRTRLANTRSMSREPSVATLATWTGLNSSTPPSGHSSSSSKIHCVLRSKCSHANRVMATRRGRSHQEAVAFEHDGAVHGLVERLSGHSSAGQSNVTFELPGDMLARALFPPITECVYLKVAR